MNKFTYSKAENLVIPSFVLGSIFMFLLYHFVGVWAYFAILGGLVFAILVTCMIMLHVMLDEKNKGKINKNQE